MECFSGCGHEIVLSLCAKCFKESGTDSGRVDGVASYIVNGHALASFRYYTST